MASYLRNCHRLVLPFSKRCRVSLPTTTTTSSRTIGFIVNDDDESSSSSPPVRSRRVSRMMSLLPEGADDTRLGKEDLQAVKADILSRINLVSTVEEGREAARRLRQAGSRIGLDVEGVGYER